MYLIVPVTICLELLNRIFHPAPLTVMISRPNKACQGEQGHDFQCLTFESCEHDRDVGSDASSNPGCVSAHTRSRVGIQASWMSVGLGLGLVITFHEHLFI